MGRYICPWAAQHFSHCLREGDGRLFHQSLNLTTSPLLFNAVDFREKPDLVGHASQEPHYIAFWPPAFWKTLVESTPLGKRGWVVQERLLLPRVVHFASDQMYWECCEQRAAELLPGIKFSEHSLTTDEGASLKILARHTRSISEDKASDLFPLHKMWSALIVRYSNCNLTFDSDRLVALSGVARGMCRQMKLEPNDYVAGLWKPTLVWDLLWKVRWKERTPRHVEDTIPSWSWASVNGAVEIRAARLKSPHKLFTRILDAQTNRGPDPFGHVLSGRIKLQGPMLRFSMVNLATSRMIDHSDVWWDHDLSKSAAENGDTYVLAIGEWDNSPYGGGLIIQPAKVQGGQFRRLGLLKEAWNIDVDLSMSKQGRLDQSLYMEAHGDLVDSYTIELV